MKKVLFIGDIHGRTDWIKYAPEAIKMETDVVFMGDYYDSFDQKSHNIEENLKRILAFKRKNDHRRAKVPERPNVTLLLGNHDYSYMMGKSATSGFDPVWHQSHRDLLNDNWDLFDLAWGYENPKTGRYTLATHAGVTADYWKNYIRNSKYAEFEFVKLILEDPWKTTSMHRVLNVLKDKFGLLWKVGFTRGGSGTPGVIWADIEELVEDPFPGINQVVGHSAWHSPELYFNEDGTFIAKVDGFGKEVRRLILNL